MVRFIFISMKTLLLVYCSLIEDKITLIRYAQRAFSIPVNYALAMIRTEAIILELLRFIAQKSASQSSMNCTLPPVGPRKIAVAVTSSTITPLLVRE